MSHQDLLKTGMKPILSVTKARTQESWEQAGEEEVGSKDFIKIPVKYFATVSCWWW